MHDTNLDVKCSHIEDWTFCEKVLQKIKQSFYDLRIKLIYVKHILFSCIHLRKYCLLLT